MLESRAASADPAPLLPESGLQRQPTDAAASRAERRAICLLASGLLLAVASIVAFAVNEHAVGLELSRISDAVRRLPRWAAAAVLGAANVVGSFAPPGAPLIAASMILAGFVLGFELGVCTQYPSHVLGQLLFFLAARRCCLGSLSAILARRKGLAAVASALRVGGLRVVVLVKLTPVPHTLLNALLASLGIPVWHFVVAEAIRDTIHTAVPVFLGASTEDVVAAFSGKSSHGREVTVAVAASGAVAALLSGVMVVVLARRELRKAVLAAQEGSVGSVLAGRRCPRPSR